MVERSESPTDVPTASAEHAEDVETFDKLLEGNSRVLVDFYADWCAPCQVMATAVDELAAEIENPIVKVDVDELPQVASRHNVSSIPTFLVFENSSEKERLVGLHEKASLSEAIA